MLKVYTPTELITDILKIKGIEYEVAPGQPPDIPDYYTGTILETRDFILIHDRIIADYLDERYPIPQLIAGNFRERAHIKIFIEHLKHVSPKALGVLVAQANPFIFGKAITIIDLILYRTSSDQAYRSFIQKVINNG